jgi:hypothetical protein
MSETNQPDAGETCSASRHVLAIAGDLARDGHCQHIVDEPKHCAESMLATVQALWAARNAARAMAVAGVSDVERLADEYASAVHDGRDKDCVTGRTALLNYVRGVIAERDALIADNERLMQIAAQEGWRDSVRKLKNLPSFLSGWQLSESCIRNNMETEVGRWIEGLGELYKLDSDAAKMVSAAPQPVFAPTEDQIQRHKIRAGDCPPDSEVLLVRSVRRFAEKAAPQPVSEPCRVDQPAGWRCTRANGHEGPCAAVEDRS